MDGKLSRAYIRKQQLLSTWEVPTISELKEQAGPVLAEVILEQCPEELKIDFGLSPPLKGPSGDLWTSPSDLLIGKVCLSPPLTRKHIQALTHEGILEIGFEIEQNFVKEILTELGKEFEGKELSLIKMYELEKAKSLTKLRKELEEKFIAEMQNVRTAYENNVNLLIWSCYQQIAQVEEQMQAEIDSLNILWTDNLQQHVRMTVDKITAEFLEKMKFQESIIADMFNRKIKLLKLKNKCAVDFEKNKCKEKILQIKHQLECQNLANLMYLLCKERRRCRDAKAIMEEKFKADQGKCDLQTTKKDKTIRKLTRFKNKKMKQLHVKERCLIEILRQFKKFIYFALKAAPTQGEFLLNIEKLLKNELDDYCIEKRPPSPPVIDESALNVTEQSTQGIQHADSPSPISESLMETVESLQSEDEPTPSDALPAFYFNNEMYIREDFRDMISAGIDIDKHHQLWNPDVEELMKIFKESINNKRRHTPIKSHVSSVRFISGTINEEPEIADPEPVNSPSQQPTRKDSPLSMEFDDEQEIRKVSLAGSLDNIETERSPPATTPRIGSRGRVTSIKNVTLGVSKAPRTAAFSPSVEDAQRAADAAPPRPSRLTCARDSVVVHLSAIEKKSLQSLSRLAAIERGDYLKEPTDEVTESLNETNESKVEEQTATSINESSDQDLKSTTTSKLVLACDSIELIRSAIALNEEGTEEPEKEVTVQSSKGPGTSKKRKGAKKPIRRTKAKIAGKKDTKYHETPADVFTEERIKDLVNLMKENPSLLQLFTSCSK